MSEVQAIIKLAGPTRRVSLDLVKPHVEKIEQLSAALGTNKVDPAINDGAFEGVVTTDNRQITADNETTLGRLSFNQWQPTDLQVVLNQGDELKKLGIDLPDLFKGVFEGQPNSSVLNFGFKLKDSGLLAVQTSIGSYEPAPDNPQRLMIKFNKLRLQPAVETDKAQWLQLLQPHNPTMNDDGVMEITLSKAPVGYRDYLAMLPDWIVVRLNLGTVAVLRRKTATV